jgi:hypothetical protein
VPNEYTGEIEKRHQFQVNFPNKKESFEYLEKRKCGCSRFQLRMTFEKTAKKRSIFHDFRWHQKHESSSHPTPFEIPLHSVHKIGNL